jgi:urease accessory protein UreF
VRVWMLRRVVLEWVAGQVLLAQATHLMKLRPSWQAIQYGRLLGYCVVRQKPSRESRQERCRMGRRFHVQAVVARLVWPFEDIPRKDGAIADTSSLMRWKETT